jgi:hypothetical protein
MHVGGVCVFRSGRFVSLRFAVSKSHVVPARLLFSTSRWFVVPSPIFLDPPSTLACPLSDAKNKKARKAVTEKNPPGLSQAQAITATTTHNKKTDRLSLENHHERFASRLDKEHNGGEPVYQSSCQRLPIIV